jgi:hypothetical protein
LEFSSRQRAVKKGLAGGGAGRLSRAGRSGTIAEYYAVHYSMRYLFLPTGPVTVAFDWRSFPAP